MLTPPPTSFPGVYWYFMDGNISREEMTRDLESMKEAGINNLIYLEVGIGVPRGPVDFMSGEWQDLFVHAVREAERLEISIRLGAGPGWCGSGGPWVAPEEAMKHLVFSDTTITGGRTVDLELAVPEQRTTVWHGLRDPYYEDVAVYAFPGSVQPVIADINEKAVYERDPYSSQPGVKPFLPTGAAYREPAGGETVAAGDILDLTDLLAEGGRLTWEAPAGEWTIVRMGQRVTGAGTRPAPESAIGLETDKLDSVAFKHHLSHYTDILLERTAPRKRGVGWTGFHMDSWECGAQNWTDDLVEEFKDRRGYDPEPYLLAYTGRVVGSVERTERFLWDLRQTCKELLLENHAGFAADYAHRNGLELTIEPYDMNPAGDLDLGSVADVIMAEFWSKRFGFATSYAVLEATSISHLSGQPIVGAEVFTSDVREAWQEYPWSMKDQSDWALALGVNRFIFHTFAHKPLGDAYRPGMTMGQYGVHWDRGQTWWPMVEAYHKYISRCSHLMQQGQAVADILYLTPEGAPMIFTPPSDALEDNGAIPDKKAYGFDGCSPMQLLDKAEVRNGKIVFPGSSYEILVLPNVATMTPELLEKIAALIRKGARVIGRPPVKSPSLTDYPECDRRVAALAGELWGEDPSTEAAGERSIGEGILYYGGALATEELYPTYASTVALLSNLGIREDFTSANNSIRFGHRETGGEHIYFVANRTDTAQRIECTFRAGGTPTLWQGTTGEARTLDTYKNADGMTTIPLRFYPYESFFVTFAGNGGGEGSSGEGTGNFPEITALDTLAGPWKVSFDTTFGGPGQIVFQDLRDWTGHELPGIRYYSGIATYRKTFTADHPDNRPYFIDLGEVNDIARVTLNGREIGVVWCAPWRIDVSAALIAGENKLEIGVANRWVNRLLGYTRKPDADVRKVKFANGLMGGKEFLTGRYTFTTEEAMRSFTFTEPLPSGLLGPVVLLTAR